MFKKSAIIIGGLTGLSCIVFGVSGTYDRVKAGVASLQDKVEENASTETLLTQALKQADTVKAGIRKAEDVVNRFSREAKQTEDTVNRKTAQKDTLAMQLGLLREHVVSGRPVIVNGSNYSAKEVAEDVNTNVSTIEKLNTEIVAHLESLKTLKQAVDRARKTLAKGKEDLAKAQSQIKALEIGVVTEQARAEVTKALAAMDGSVKEGEGELASTLSEIKRRLDHAQEENNARTGEVKTNIVWDEVPAPSTLVDRIDAVIQPVQTVPKATVPASSPTPGADGVKIAGL